MYRGNDTTMTITEESPHYDSLCTDSHDGQRLLDAIPYKGGYYRMATLKLAHNALACSACHAVCAAAHLVTGRCSECRGETVEIDGKNSPPDGWRKYGQDTPYFGIEFECEFPNPTPETRINGLQAFREIVRQGEWYLPLAFTYDSSLRNGVELNTHMMTLDYLRANNHLITHTIGRLKEAGASQNGVQRDGSLQETAGLHVHIDIDAINIGNQSHLQKWLVAIRDFLLEFSFRSENRFHHNCESGYSYFGQRNKSYTWECRGFSSKLLLEHPDALPHICAWVDTLAYVSRNPWLIFESPATALKQAGHEATATYIRDTLHVVRIDTVPAITPDQPNNRNLRAQCIRLNDGRDVWLEDINGNALMCRGRSLSGGIASIYASVADVAHWYTNAPAPMMTPAEHRAHLIACSAIPPVATPVVEIEQTEWRPFVCA